MQAARQPVADGQKVRRYAVNAATIAAIVVTLVAWVFFLSTIDISPGPSALPDRDSTPLRDDHDIAHARVAEVVREVAEPFSLSLHYDDAGPFMNELMHQAEASGGYVRDSRWYADAFEPSYYKRLVLMVPESFVDEMQPLRASETKDGKGHYREWFFSRDGIGALPPIAPDLVKVTVEARYHGSGSIGSVDFSKLYLAWLGFSILIFGVCLYVNSRMKSDTPADHALTREDLEWTRVGDEIRGQYRDYILYLQMIPETRFGKSYFTVRVLRQMGGAVASDKANSADVAIEKGLSVIRRQLDARRSAEDIFDKLVGKPSEAGDPHSTASTVNRDRGDFQRYMA